MNAVFKKLDFEDQPAVYILNAPASFHPAMNEMCTLTEVQTGSAGPKEASLHWPLPPPNPKWTRSPIGLRKLRRT